MAAALRPPADVQAPVPVLFDRSGERYVVLREDGSIDQNPTLRLRG